MGDRPGAAVTHAAETGADARAPVVGIIGLGRIGRPIAARLRDAGHALVVFDVDAAAMSALPPHAQCAASAADVGARADIVIGCLQTVEQYHAAILGDDGLVRGTRVRTYVHIGTTGSACVQALAAALGGRGIVTVDAPMSGGVAGATAGTLVSMVAGPRDACTRVEPILAAYSSRIRHLGNEPGLAQTMKLVNNMVSAANLVVAAEAMVVGAKAGLPVDTMLDVINHGTGQNNATLTKIPNNIATRRFDVGSTLANGVKDLSAYADEARAAGIDSALCAAVLACFAEAGRQGTPGDDFAKVVRPFERAAGVELRSEDDA